MVSIRLKHEAFVRAYEKRQMRDRGPSDFNTPWYSAVKPLSLISTLALMCRLARHCHMNKTHYCYHMDIPNDDFAVLEFKYRQITNLGYHPH
jgi:hypothetical protein